MRECVDAARSCVAAGRGARRRRQPLPQAAHAHVRSSPEQRRDSRLGAGHVGWGGQPVRLTAPGQGSTRIGPAGPFVFKVLEDLPTLTCPTMWPFLFWLRRLPQ